MTLHLDIESRSDIDLPARGAHVYAAGVHTDILCVAYAFDDGPVELWLPGEMVPERVSQHICLGLPVWAHNAAFERLMINGPGSRYGWPMLHTDQMVCTMAMAFAMGLPGSLAGAAAALGLEAQKDLVGKRLMMQVSQPRDILPGGEIIWWDDLELLKRLYDYCIQDVKVEREAGHRMMKLSKKEREIYNLDQKINDRGVAVDMPAARAALSLVDCEKHRLNKEIQSVSGNQIASCSAVAQIKKFIGEHGVPVKAVAKQDVVDLLDRPDLPKVCRDVLWLRQEASKASTAKLKAMVEGSGKGQAPGEVRIRGTFQYSGANTRRWAGRRIQLQNLPRPKLSPGHVDNILSGLAKGSVDAESIDLVFGPPMSVISNCIRGFLIASPGKELLACDFSAIEARVIAWLAGEQKVLEIFNGHGKIYEHAASGIFGKPIGQISDSERQVGKVAVLALGYQGGVGAFQSMARNYAVRMEPAYNTLRNMASPDDLAWATSRFDAFDQGHSPISEREFVASDLTKTFWRRANPKIVEMWGNLESAAIQAVQSPGLKTQTNRVAFRQAGSFLWCKLPSGGVICYPYPKVEQVKTRWGKVKTTLTYMAEENFKWQRFPTYGGSLVENVTQAVARDLLAEAMLRLDALGYDIVAHVHDEIVLEVDENSDLLSEVAKIMSIVPDWAPGLPLKAAGWQGKRYRK